jgi:hypothetical protein
MGRMNRNSNKKQVYFIILLLIFRVQKIEYYHEKENQLKSVYGKVELYFFCQHRYNQRSLFKNEEKRLTGTKKNIFDF